MLSREGNSQIGDRMATQQSRSLQHDVQEIEAKRKKPKGEKIFSEK